jgi:hypothetical protein
MSLSLPYRGCETACAREKLTKSQLESWSALNSEAIIGWVAMSSEPSALEMKLPMRRTHTMRPTETNEVSATALEVV